MMIMIILMKITIINTKNKYNNNGLGRDTDISTTNIQKCTSKGI